MFSKHKSCCVLVALTIVLELMLINNVRVAEAVTAKPGCQEKCGNVVIPYPFGIGNPSCFHDQWFEVVCSGSNTPFLNKFNIEVNKVVFPSYANQIPYLGFNNPILASSATCANGTGKATTAKPLDFIGSPFHFSQHFTTFAGSGCNNQVWMIDRKAQRIGKACTSTCLEDANVDGDCCKTTLPKSIQLFNVSFSSTADSSCKYAIFGHMDEWFKANLGERSCSPAIIRNTDYVPAWLIWGLDSSTPEAQALQEQSNNKSNNIGVVTYNFGTGSNVAVAFCADGFQGSAYVPNGCRDINECLKTPSPCNSTCENSMGGYNCIGPKSNIQIAMIVALPIVGVLLLILAIWLGLKLMKRRKERKYFVQNGGLLLECDGKTRLFKAEELTTATNNFSQKNRLGGGGQGTVYKGTLPSGTLVAIKECNKTKSPSQMSKRDQMGGAFINEVALLSETIHKNIVRLLGCCLETESPLLVYEYLINGDLAHHLQNDRNHNNADQFTLSWEMRLRIAAEVAEGLSYLHLQAGVGIYHRDVKTDNILLDNKYTAKLADFGISKSVSVNESRVSVDVQGSPGYIDPEYMDSKQYTDKSDVYSFGVVLAELLTGKRPVFSYVSHEMGEEMAVVLAFHFKELETAQIMRTFLDARVKHQGMKSEVEAVIEIAKRCLEKEGRKRPKMKDVAMELEKIRAAQTNIYAEEIDEYDYEKSVDVMSTPPRDKEITRPLRVQGSQLSDDIC